MTGIYDNFNKQNEVHNKKCICNSQMDYSLLGYYKCPVCGREEKDLYGKICDLLDMNPKLTKMEIANILGIAPKELSPYIDGKYIINPLVDILK